MAREKRYILIFLLLFIIKLLFIQSAWAQVDPGESTVNADDPVFVEYSSEIRVFPRDSGGNIVEVDSDDLSVDFEGTSGRVVVSDFEPIFRRNTLLSYRAEINTNEAQMLEGRVIYDGARPMNLGEFQTGFLEISDRSVTETLEDNAIADGEDEVLIGVRVFADDRSFITGIRDEDFELDFKAAGPPEIESIEEDSELEGLYVISITNTEVGSGSYELNIAGRFIGSDSFTFEGGAVLVDLGTSEVDATSPHLADGNDASTVTATLRDSNGNLVEGVDENDLFLSVNASNPDMLGIENFVKTGAGQFEAKVTSTIAETMEVEVFVDSEPIEDKDEIIFFIPEVDPGASSVQATSPHDADGSDASTVTVTVIDDQGNPMDNVSDFSLDLTGDAISASDISNEGGGEYEIWVTNNTPETVTVTVTVEGTQLDDTPQIVFEEEEPDDPVVDASESSVEATSPHLADGEDASTVTITVIDDQGNPMDDVSDFSLDLTGDAIPASDISNEGGGDYEILVTNTTPETVTVTVTVEGTDLEDQPQILFEAVEEPVPETPEITEIEVVDEGVEIRWDIPSTDYVDQFVIYRGSSPDDLEPYAEVSAGSTQFIDENPEAGTNFYAVSVVNATGQESSMSEVVSFYNSELFVSDEWIMVSSPVAGAYEIDHSATLFSFSDRYEQADAISETKGYWMKSSDDSDFELPIRGEGITETTISLNEGWNMIGSLSYGIPASSIIDPSGILTNAPVYHYSNGEYISVDELNPNLGYWLYASESGTVELNLESSEKIQQSALTGNQQIVSVQQTMPLLEIRSGERSQQLFISDGELSVNEKKQYLLPPKAPEMALDARSQDGLKVLNSDGDSFTVQSTEYPVSITLEDQGQNVEYKLVLVREGVERTVILDRHQSTELMHEYDEIILKKASSEDVIGDHKLLPNYPNPFNPATTIQYQIMENTHVNLEVFDVSGRRVQILADEVQQAGHYRTEFDGSNLASGMYMVRLRAGDQVHIQKISLIK